MSKEKENVTKCDLILRQIKVASLHIPLVLQLLSAQKHNPISCTRMPGERFISGATLEESPRDDSHIGESCRSAIADLRSRLVHYPYKTLCTLCSCNDEGSKQCQLTLCGPKKSQHCEYIEVHESCCDSLCDESIASDDQVIWVASGAAAAIAGFLLVGLFVAFYMRRRFAQRTPVTREEELDVAGERNNSLRNVLVGTTGNNPSPESMSVAVQCQSKTSGKCPADYMGSPQHIPPSFHPLPPSAPLLSSTDMDGGSYTDAAASSVLNSSDSLNSDCLGRCTPPPTYEEVLLDDRS